MEATTTKMLQEAYFVKEGMPSSQRGPADADSAVSSGHPVAVASFAVRPCGRWALNRDSSKCKCMMYKRRTFYVIVTMIKCNDLSCIQNNPTFEEC